MEGFQAQMPDGIDPSIANGLMVFSATMEPFIEWAEGQKEMMKRRGWSAESADAYARELLIGLQRSMFAQAMKQQ